MQRTLLAALIGGLFTPLVTLPATAQDTPLLDEIVVTATRTASAASSLLAQTTVIRREDIEHAHAADLMQLLDQYAGLHVTRTGGEGKATSVFLRGTGPQHVLVLVDGIRASSSTTGEYDWNALSPEQIERIEIVRGPLSSLYGSDAVGGVIQIFTRQRHAPGLKLTVGSRNTQGIQAGLGGAAGKGDWRYSLDVGRESTAGLPTFNNDATTYGFNRTHAALSLDGSLTPDLFLALRLNQSQGHNELDTNTGDNDYANRVASVKLHHQANEHWSHTLTLGHARDEYTSFSPWLPATITTNRQSLAWQHDLNLSDGQINIGLDHWRDHATKDDSGTIDERLDNSGLFAQYRTSALGGNLQLGARRDRHEAFGQHHTWNIGWGRELLSGLRLSLSHGTAFKAPTVNDLYWPYSSDGPYAYTVGTTTYSDTYITHGNTALKPETSRSSELGLRFRQNTWEMGANLFETRIDDLIEWAPTITPGGTGASGEILTTYEYQPENVSRARLRGLELSLRTHWLDWQWQGAFTRLQALNLTTGQQLDRRPESSLSVSASRHWGAHHLRLEALANGPASDIRGTRHLAGHGLANAVYEYALDRAQTLGLRIDNLFDHDYAVAVSSSRDYAAPGRGLFMSWRYQPKP